MQEFLVRTDQKVENPWSKSNLTVIVRKEKQSKAIWENKNSWKISPFFFIVLSSSSVFFARSNEETLEIQ